LDQHYVINYLIERNAKNYAGQRPIDVCDRETFEFLNEKPSLPSLFKNEKTPLKPGSISHNENFNTANEAPT
jgi:hypothetical protein